MRINFVLVVFGLLFIFSCSQSVDEMVEDKKDSGKQWVDMELMVKSSVDTISYYYAGQIDKSTLKEFQLNKPGMFQLSNIRFYKGDSIFKYEDGQDDGTVYFQRRDVLKCVLLKQDPWLDSTKAKGN